MQTTGLVNHLLLLLPYDDDFGPFFVKFCSYFPYNAKLCIQRQPLRHTPGRQAGIGFTALDNGFATITTRQTSSGLQRICDV